MHVLILTLLLLLIAVCSGMLARVGKLRVPLPLAQIGAGVVAALLGLHLPINPELFMVLFLPPLLFADSFRMPLREFRQLKVPIFSMAIGVVLFSTILCGYAVHWMLPALDLAVCFTLAAALSPTDTVAVSSLLEGRRIPARILHLLSGEALFNDATGLVCFRFASAAALSGAFSYSKALEGFLLVSGGGLAIGVIMAFCASWIDRIAIRLGYIDPSLQIVMMLLLPFAIYIAADSVGCSGILAVVAGCMTIKMSGILQEAPTATRLNGTIAWDLIGYVFNAMIFVLLGLQLPELLHRGLKIAHAHNASGWVLAGLIFSVFGVMLLLRFCGLWFTIVQRMIAVRLSGSVMPRPSLASSLLVTLAGVRGAVTLAAVLSLPTEAMGEAEFPARGLLISVSAGVIVLSLLVASVGLPILSRLTPSTDGEPIEREEVQARVALVRAALETIREEQKALVDAPDGARDEARIEIVARLARLYEGRLTQIDDGEAAASDVREDALQRERLELALRLRLVRAQRKALRGLHNSRAINDETEWSMQQELDFEEQMLRRRARRLPHKLSSDASTEAAAAE